MTSLRLAILAALAHHPGGVSSIDLTAELSGSWKPVDRKTVAARLADAVKSGEVVKVEASDPGGTATYALKALADAPPEPVESLADLIARVRKPNPTAVAWNFTRKLVATDGPTLTFEQVAAVIAHYFPKARPLSPEKVAEHYAAVGKAPRN